MIFQFNLLRPASTTNRPHQFSYNLRINTFIKDERRTEISSQGFRLLRLQIKSEDDHRIWNRYTEAYIRFEQYWWDNFCKKKTSKIVLKFRWSCSAEESWSRCKCRILSKSEIRQFSTNIIDLFPCIFVWILWSLIFLYYRDIVSQIFSVSINQVWISDLLE